MKFRYLIILDKFHWKLYSILYCKKDISNNCFNFFSGSTFSGQLLASANIRLAISFL